MDFAPLLAPINVDSPGGNDLSFSPDIDAIQEMRREDDPSLDQGEWVTTLKTADWAGTARACESILATKSKDLRVAGWLTDAWARLHGFEGLGDGLGLVAGLMDGYWQQLHPLPDHADRADHADHEQRIGNLRWLAARVEQLAPSIPLIVHGGRKLTLTDVAGARSKRLADSANPNAASSRSTSAPSTDSVLTLELVWRDVASSGRQASRTRRTAVTRAVSGLALLQTAVDARLGDEAPSFAAARTALDNVLDELTRLERECGLTEAPASESAVADNAAEDKRINLSGAEEAPRVFGRIETRTQALEHLRLVAAFFRATEPHSPIAYLADKAVRWSEMPLHEWLRTVVKDEGSLSHIEELLGVEKPTGP